VEPVATLLRLYDSQLQTTPVNDLLVAHRRAGQNFRAPAQEQLSIAALVQRSKRTARLSSSRSERRGLETANA
ncbi:hypothetical protein PQR16_35325, partial [Caballeronia glebae]